MLSMPAKRPAWCIAAVVVLLGCGVPESTAFPRHSQAYLAQRAAAAMAACAARNQTYVPRVPKVQVKAARRASTQQPQAGDQQAPLSVVKGAAAGAGYPSGITSVFKSLRREEEEAADARFAF